MDYYFGMSEEEIRAQQRPIFLEKWRKTEKTLERIGGILFIFAAALLISWERASDELTLMAAAVLITGGIYLLFVYSRRPDEKRSGLRFLDHGKQIQYAWMAAMGALILALNINRPLMIIVAGVLVILAIWFRWRAYQIRQFDKLFVNTENSSKDESENSEV